MCYYIYYCTQDYLQNTEISHTTQEVLLQRHSGTKSSQQMRLAFSFSFTLMPVASYTLISYIGLTPTKEQTNRGNWFLYTCGKILTCRVGRLSRRVFRIIMGATVQTNLQRERVHSRRLRSFLRISRSGSFFRLMT